MTVKEFYEWCLEKGIENYLLTSYECSSTYEITEDIISIHVSNQTIEV